MKAVIITVYLCVSSILAAAFSPQVADWCYIDKCYGECHCPTVISPLSEGVAPQLIALTVDESVVNASYNNYWEPLLIGRTNPDGNPISGTFFVPHDYTDYQRVHDLYINNFEIAAGSITRNGMSEYWLKASKETLIEEFQGQRIIISTFANIPIEDITGARAPMLILQGDSSIDAYVESGIVYDSSIKLHNGRNIFPYTLDYRSSEDCLNVQCPSESHPGFWEVPIIDLADNVKECNSLWDCPIKGTADDIAAWLNEQVENRKADNRAPMILMLSSAFFEGIENSLEGFQKFLDGLSSDVFLVSVKQIIDWTKNPVPADQYRTEVPERTTTCRNFYCPLLKMDDEAVRYMHSCTPCPEVYPWIGNPYGDRNLPLTVM